MTEFGWASAGPASAFTTDEAGQAARTREAVGELSRRRSELGLAGLVFYDWRDKRATGERSDFFGLHTGLLRADGSAKPALEGFSEAARAAERRQQR